MRKLAERLGVNHHASPLRFKLKRLLHEYPLPFCRNLEEWLISVANERGFRIVQSPARTPGHQEIPTIEQLSNEELAVAMCQAECLDVPQMLRLPAQIISRKAVDIDALLLVAKRERAERVLAELARQACKVNHKHGYWKKINKTFGCERGFATPILHWTRLAEPIMNKGRCNADKWRLVA